MTLMKVLPRSAVSTVVGRLTRAPLPAWAHHSVIRRFARHYRVNLEEAQGAIEDFSNFGEFFTRKLKPGLRTIAPGDKVVASPVDGAISQIGVVNGGKCVQAKGIDFPVDKLLGDTDLARAYDGGAFATLYLSPRDYHRIHAPLAGTITGYSYLPGEFWPVNPASVRNVDALFAVNERLVTYLATPLGKVAVVAVGATCVSRIHPSYVDLLTHQGQSAQSHTFEQPIAVEKGGELGMFEMGSTVILVFEKGRMTWDPGFGPDAPVKLGQRLGEGA